MKDYLKILKTTCKDWLKSRLYKSKSSSFINNHKKIYVMLAATYPNLGDLAITEAQIQFLKDNFPDYEIVDVDVNETLKFYKNMKKNITKDDIITLIGGGNNGDLYEFIESKRRFIIRNFKNTKIISFPQSVSYKENSTYKKEFIKLARKCDNLIICAREKITYDKYKKMGLKNVYLIPDIVFYLNKYIPKNTLKSRAGISFVFRNDKEKKMSKKTQNNIINYIKEGHLDYEFADTCDITYTGNRKKIVQIYIENLLKKKLVITDRLHGMILCYITNTPCIAIDNNNHKISSTFETWLTNQDFIKIWDGKTDIKILIEKLLKTERIKKEDITINFKNLQKMIGDNHEKFKN